MKLVPLCDTCNLQFDININIMHDCSGKGFNNMQINLN